MKRPYPFLFGSTLLLETALNLPMGMLPLVLASEGVSPGMIGLVMGSGTFCALFASLPSGVFVDRFGHLRTMCWTGRLSMLVLFGLVLTHGVLWGCLLMGLRSIVMTAWGTAKLAYVGSLFSEARAVAAVTIVGILGSIPVALGPALSVLLWQHGVVRQQYVYGLMFVLLGIALLEMLPRNVPDRRCVHVEHAVFRRSWLPILGWVVASRMEMGLNFSLAVLTFHERGIANGALLFTSAAFVSFLLRYPIGRLVEIFGPLRAAVPITLLEMVGCILAAFASTTTDVLLAGIGLGVAWGGVLPVAIELLFEENSRHARGATIGAYNFACSLGGILGAGLAMIAAPTGLGYVGVILICGAAPLLMLPVAARSRASFLKSEENVVFQTSLQTVCIDGTRKQSIAP